MHDLNSSDPLVRAAAHAGLGLPLPRKVRFRFLKRIVARLTWLTNRHQCDYNRSVIEAIEQLRRDLPTALSADIAAHTSTLAAGFATDLAVQATALSASYVTDLVALEASLRSELAATLMRAAGQDGEIASAAAGAATAAAAIHDLRGDIDARLADFAQRLDRLEAAQARAEARARSAQIGPLSFSTASDASSGDGDLLGGLDRARFTARFRGSDEMIAARQLVLVDQVVGVTGTIIDLGSGRGEWLRLLRSKGLTAIGVDDDAASVQILRDEGLDVVHADALTYLRGAADASVGVISALQVIEHLPFATTVALLREALRVLIPGGRLLVETPNIANLHVGASTFYLDPSHVQPIHPSLLEFALQDIGFVEVEMQLLHPRQALEVPPVASPQLALVIESLNQALNAGQDVLATAVRPQHA